MNEAGVPVKMGGRRGKTRMRCREALLGVQFVAPGKPKERRSDRALQIRLKEASWGSFYLLYICNGSGVVNSD